MKNKGFTLIELLAVIVILAIIMVIAVPQILNVIDSSRTSAWNDSTKLIVDAIRTNSKLFDPSTGAQTYSVENICLNNKLSEIADVGDMTTTCKKQGTNYIFTLTGQRQFDGKGYIFICDSEAYCYEAPKWEGYYYYQAGGRYTDNFNNVASDFWVQVNNTLGVKEACRYSMDEGKGDILCIKSDSWDCGNVSNNNCSNSSGYIASKLSEFRDAGATCTWNGSYFGCSVNISGVSAGLMIYDYGRVEAYRGGHACAANESFIACPY